MDIPKYTAEQLALIVKGFQNIPARPEGAPPEIFIVSEGGQFFQRQVRGDWVF